MRYEKKNQKRFTSVAAAALLTFSGCAGLSPGNTAVTVSAPGITVDSPSGERLALLAYPAVHAFYSGLLLPLDLVTRLSLYEKFELLDALYRNTRATIGIPDYFSRGELLIRTSYRAGPPPVLHWTSNAVYSPLSRGPLRGTGEFLPEGSGSANISGIIFLKEGFAVNIEDIYSRDAENYYLQGRFYNNLADLYIHDGLPGNDALIPSLLKKAFTSTPRHSFIFELTRIQYYLMDGRFSEAERHLNRLGSALKMYPEGSGLDDTLGSFFRYTYEEYVLTRSLDTRNTDFLIEYSSFMNFSSASGEQGIDDSDSGTSELRTGSP